MWPALVNSSSLASIYSTKDFGTRSSIHWRFVFSLATSFVLPLCFLMFSIGLRCAPLKYRQRNLFLFLFDIIHITLKFLVLHLNPPFSLLFFSLGLNPLYFYAFIVISYLSITGRLCKSFNVARSLNCRGSLFTAFLIAHPRFSAVFETHLVGFRCSINDCWHFLLHFCTWI